MTRPKNIARTVADSDSGFRHTTRKPEVPIGRLWKYCDYSLRAQVLNESEIIDHYCSTYLELANLIDRWCQRDWEDLPAPVRKYLDRTYGWTRALMRRKLKQAPPDIRNQLAREIGITLNPKRRRKNSARSAPLCERSG